MSSMLIRSYGRIGVKALSQWPTVSPWTSIVLFVYESIFRCHLRIGGRKGEQSRIDRRTGPAHRHHEG